MEFVSILDNRIADIKFAFAPIGGCAEFSFKALSRYCTEIHFGANFNVRIYKRNDSTKNYDLVYQGRIEVTENDPQFSEEDIKVSGFGYQTELKDIVINATYSSTEISVIVKDLLDNYIVPNTNITYSASDIESTGFSPTSITFSYVTAQDAMDKLAEIYGTREYGVDKDRKFYFKARTDSVGWRYPIGKKLEKFRINSSSREIINRVIVIGGDVSGSKFVYTKDYTTNQNKYKRRDRIIQNSAVKDSTTAGQLADAVQAAGNGVVDRGSFTIRDEIIFETTIPVPLFDVITREILWDEKEWDTFLWAGQSPFRILRINYEITEEGALVPSVEFGAPLPDIVESIKQLEFSINNAVQSEA